MSIPALIEKIASEVLSWSDHTLHIYSQPHRYGGVEFRLITNLQSKEIGHIHDFGVLDILFTKAVREQLAAEGKVKKHHYVPESGWISYHLNCLDALPHALWLLRLSHTFHVFRLTKNVSAVREQLQRLQVSSEIGHLILSKNTSQQYITNR
jgi:hypothetical protein